MNSVGLLKGKPWYCPKCSQKSVLEQFGNLNEMIHGVSQAQRLVAQQFKDISEQFQDTVSAMLQSQKSVADQIKNMQTILSEVVKAQETLFSHFNANNNKCDSHGKICEEIKDFKDYCKEILVDKANEALSSSNTNNNHCDYVATKICEMLDIVNFIKEILNGMNKASGTVSTSTADSVQCRFVSPEVCALEKRKEVSMYICLLIVGLCGISKNYSWTFHGLLTDFMFKASR